MKYLSQILKTYSNKYLLVSLLIVLLCPVLVFSYSSFIETSNKYKSNEMMIGNLLYSMKINGISTSSINCAPGETEAVIEITTLSDMETKYKLVYPTTEGISVVYASDENEPAFGGILATRKISIMINNTTGSNVTINFGVTGGYNHNDLSDVIIPDGYSEIANSYIKYDYETIALFVDGVRLADNESLNSNTDYLLSSYNCTNGETVNWSIKHHSLTITPMNDQTKCTLNFTTHLSYVSSGLVLNYDGIDNTSTGHSNSASTWYNKVGNGYNATLYNTTWNNNALVLNGTTSYGVFSNPVFNGIGNVSNCTIEIVLDFASSKHGAALDFGSKINGYSAYLTIWNSGGNTASIVLTGGTNYSKSSSLSYELNKKYQISYGIGSTEGFVYNNGTFSTKAGADPSILVGWGSSNGNIGRAVEASNSSVYYYFGGKIYALRIYNRVLSEDEIYANYKVDKARYGIN